MIAHIPVNFRNKIPKLYEQQNRDSDIVYAIYYIEGSDWRWFIFESSSLQNLFYGYSEPCDEYHYFTIEDLQKITYEYGVDIELENIKPTSLKELL